MSTRRVPVPVEKRYPTLRFLVVVYKVVGVLVLGGSILLGIGQLAIAIRDDYGFFNLTTMVGTILSGFSISAFCWLLAEGIEVFIDIEQNTRQSAHMLATAGTASATPGETREMTAHLEAIVRLLDVVTVYQQQTTQRLDSLATEIHAMRENLDTSVQTMETVAESSKAVAKILYHQGVNHG